MQTGSVPVRRRGRIVVATVALLAGGWLLTAAPAAAHALVVGSNPQAGARIARAPAELRVAFSEPVRPLGPGLTLQGPRGQVRLGPVRHPDGRPEVLAATLPTLGDGSYLAGWRIVSADDGHLEAGSFAFAVGAGSGPVASPAPPQLPSPWQVAGRWLETAGVLWLVGIVTAALTVWRRPQPIGPDEPRWWPLTVAAVAVGAVGLAWQVAAGAATSGGLGPGAVGSFLTASPATGRRMLVELALLAATATLVWSGVGRSRRPGLGALALTAGAVVALALGAHDTGLSPRWLFIPLEVVHLLAVGAWVGGLAVLALTARRARLDAVRHFSVLALRVVVVVAVTGIWQGLAQVSSRAALTRTDYGRVLAVKAAVFLVVLGLAAMARLRLLPRASAQPGGTPGGLRRLLAVEASGGAAVVLVAALLANTVPAGEVLAAASAARVRGGPQSQQLQAGPLRLQLGLEPGTVGRNLLQVHVTDPQGRPVDGLARIDLTIADQAGRAAPATLSAARVAPAAYRAVTDAFALAGTWRVGVTVPGASPGLAASFAIAAAPATAGTPPSDPPDAVVLGGQTGSALVGLTAMTAGELLVVRVRGGLGIPPAVAPRPLRVRGADGRALAALVQPCGDGCAEAFLASPARGPLVVEAVLPNKGTARFTLPWPLARPAPGRLRAADRALGASRSFRIHEVLTGGLGTVFRTDYVLAAPNRARWHLDTGSSTTDTVWIGERRWMRDGAGPWKLQSAPGLELRFPARNWSDQVTNIVALGPATWHHTPAQVLAFVDPANNAYHRLWVDHANHILHERMDAPGHFMDRDYTAYGTPVTITPPRQP
jgi:copper transport protein